MAINIWIQSRRDTTVLEPELAHSGVVTRGSSGVKEASQQSIRQMGMSENDSNRMHFLHIPDRHLGELDGPWICGQRLRTEGIPGQFMEDGGWGQVASMGENLDVRGEPWLRRQEKELLEQGRVVVVVVLGIAVRVVVFCFAIDQLDSPPEVRGGDLITPDRCLTQALQVRSLKSLHNVLQQLFGQSLEESNACHGEVDGEDVGGKRTGYCCCCCRRCSCS